MRIGNKQFIDKILFLCRRRLLAAAAALLRTVIRDRLRFHIAAVRQRHYHLFRRNQVFRRKILRLDDNFAVAFLAVLLFNFAEFLRNDARHTCGFGEHVEQIDDFFHRLFVLGGDLVGFERGQVLQAHFKNALRLHVG